MSSSLSIIAILFIANNYLITTTQASTNNNQTQLNRIANDFIDISQSLHSQLAHTEYSKQTNISSFMNSLNNIKDIMEGYDKIAMKTLGIVLPNIPKEIRVEYNTVKILEYLNWIDSNYYSMVQYANNLDRIERDTLKNFADAILHGANSMSETLKKIYFVLSPFKNPKSDVLHKLAAVVKNLNSAERCSLGQSPRQFLQNFYNTLALAELKGFINVHFSFLVLKKYFGSFEEEIQLVNEKFKERSTRLFEEFVDVWDEFGHEYWRCDPEKFVKGESYEEITQLLQGVIANEEELGGCKNTCWDHNYSGREVEACRGQMYNCHFMEPNMKLCPAPKTSPRKYEFVTLESGRRLGDLKNCRVDMTDKKSWKWWFWNCHYCLCICDEQGLQSDRFFSLRSTVADIGNNRVVTAVRFLKVNRIMHLQIQQAKLLERATIDEKTLEWVPIKNFSITDQGIQRFKDYHMMTFYNRSIDIDDIKVEEKHVVTGVRFILFGSSLKLEVAQTPFNFTTGKLTDPHLRTYWDGNLHGNRSKLLLGSSDVPTKTTRKNIINSKSNQYMDFTYSSINQDAAQTTIPFIDIQPVESIVASPLEGVGLYHKRVPGFGGYIGLKTFHYDMKKHIKPLFDKIL